MDSIYTTLDDKWFGTGTWTILLTPNSLQFWCLEIPAGIYREKEVIHVDSLNITALNLPAPENLKLRHKIATAKSWWSVKFFWGQEVILPRKISWKYVFSNIKKSKKENKAEIFWSFSNRFGLDQQSGDRFDVCRSYNCGLLFRMPRMSKKCLKWELQYFTRKVKFTTPESVSQQVSIASLTG